MNVITDLTLERHSMNMFILMRGTINVRDTCKVKLCQTNRWILTSSNVDEDYKIHDNQYL